MKKVLVSLIITIVLFLGIGSVNALDIKQESLTVDSKSSTITVLDEGIGNLEVKPKIEFNVVGDYITYKLVLKNTDGKKYRVESVTDNNSNDHIKTEYDYNKNLNTDNKTILITLKYDKKITDPSTKLKSIRVTIKLIDEDNNKQDININGNNNNDNNIKNKNSNKNSSNKNENSPQTGDNIGKHFGLLLTSLIGLSLGTIYLIRNKNKKYSKGLLSILLLVTLVPSMVYAGASKEIVFNIDFTDISIKLKHKVEFDSNGGTAIDSQVIDDNEKANKPADPTKKGYTFVKWLDENNAFDFDTNITKDITLKAEYKIDEYTINYNLDGGSATNPDKYTIESDDIKLNNPTKEGHKFTGWTGSDIAGLSKDVTIKKGSTGDKEYTANYEINKYTVSFDSNGSAPIPSQTVDYNGVANKPSDPQKEGYTFVKWLDENNNEYNFDNKVKKDINLKAEYKINEYTVNFDSNGGSTVQNQTVKHNDTATKPEDPTKDHYIFAKWLDELSNAFDFVTKIIKDRFLKAEWSPKEYTITYKLNGGTVTPDNPTTYTIETNDFTLNNPTPPADKVFKGWKEKNETTLRETVTITKGTTGNLEYEAVYNDLYTVTFNPNGGTIASSDTTRKVEKGNAIGDLPAVTPPEGKIFDGWYVDTTLIDKNYIVTKNTEVKAKYTDPQDVTDIVDPEDPEVITDDNGNDRFTGFEPKNYIWYNCKSEPTKSWSDSDYASSCERWRILGTFDKVEDSQGNIEKRAKIIRDDYLPGNYAWDSSAYNINSGGGINEWSQADLMYELNGDYLDYTKTGTTTWYNGSKNKKTEPYDYKYSLSRYAQTLIKEADWWYGYTNIYNGGFSFPIMNSAQRKFMKVARVYELERTEYNVKEKTGATYDSLARGTKIFKVVGLPSLSDYGYATSGDNDESIRLGCLNSDLEYDYGVFSGKKCHMYNWLHNGTKAVWTINRLYDFPTPQNTGVWSIATKGGIVGYPASGSMVSSTTYEFYVRPSVFLKKDVVSIGGSGTKADPYKIMLNE